MPKKWFAYPVLWFQGCETPNTCITSLQIIPGCPQKTCLMISNKHTEIAITKIHTKSCIDSGLTPWHAYHTQRGVLLQLWRISWCRRCWSTVPSGALQGGTGEWSTNHSTLLPNSPPRVRFTRQSERHPLCRAKREGLAKLHSNSCTYADLWPCKQFAS